MQKIETGKIIDAEVTGIEKYGFFVKSFNDYTGLIHLSEISNNFVRDINEYVTLNEKIKVKILAVDNEKKQLKLSIKNIEYRINKPTNKKIIETSKGFATLSSNLNGWINDKKKEIEKKENKN